MSITPRNRPRAPNRCIRTLRYPRRAVDGEGPVRQSGRWATTIATTTSIASLGGFHRSWLVYLGLELGLFERIRAAGADGHHAGRPGGGHGDAPRGRRGVGVGVATPTT